MEIALIVAASGGLFGCIVSLTRGTLARTARKSPAPMRQLAPR